MESSDPSFGIWLLKQVLWILDWVSDFGYGVTATWIRESPSRSTADKFDLKFLHKSLINSEWMFWDPWYSFLYRGGFSTIVLRSFSGLYQLQPAVCDRHQYERLSRNSRPFERYFLKKAERYLSFTKRPTDLCKRPRDLC